MIENHTIGVVIPCYRGGETSQRHIFFSWYILTVFGIKYLLNYLVISVILDFLTISDDSLFV